MNEVIDLKVLQDYRIWLKFNDGEEKVINIRPYIGKGFTAELLDKEKFQKAFIEPGGGIAWENGYDNYLKELALENQQVLQ